MTIVVTYTHPEDSTLIWSGRGRRPDWVEAWLARPGSSLSDLLKFSIKDKVTDAKNFAKNKNESVTKLISSHTESENTQNNHPVKKRGRPSTGKALSPAERKRASRSRLRDLVTWGTQDEITPWLEQATVAQLLDAYALATAQKNGRLATEVAGRLIELAARLLKAQACGELAP